MVMSSYLNLALPVLLLAMMTGYAAGDCGGTFNKTTNGTLILTLKSTDTNCVWYIITEQAGQVMINFNSLVLDSSNLTVIAGNESTSPQIVQKNKFSGPVTVISHAKITRIVFNRGVNDTDASLDANFNTENCSVIFTATKGVIKSPVYRENSGDVKCVYEILMPSNVDVPVLSFSEFNWTDATLSVTFDKGTAQPIASPDDVLGPAGTTKIQLSMLINNGTVKTFKAVFQTADKGCSGAFKSKPDGSVGTLTFPDTNALPIQCYAQIEASDNAKQIYVANIGASRSVGGGDSVLFLDGATQEANVIGSLNSGAPWFVSSGSKMTIIASLGTKTARDVSLQYNEDAFSKLYTLSDTAPSVNISLNGSSVAGKEVRLLVQTSTMVNVDFNGVLANTDIKVTVQDIKANTLFVYSKATVVFPLDTPVGGALILVSGLTGTASLEPSLELTVSQSNSTDCYGYYQGSSGSISSKLNKDSPSGCTELISTGQKDSATILQLESAKLCPGSKIAIIAGTGHVAAKLGTITSVNSGTSLPQIQFAPGIMPRLQWSVVDTSCDTQALTARYWTVKSVCSSLGSGTTGNVQTPNFPNQYPLNAQCTWPVPAQDKTFLYLSANTVQFGAPHSLTLMQNGSTTLTTFQGTTLPNDQIFPNDQLSMLFSSKANNFTQLDTPGQGADITYKILTCGGSITNVSTPIANPTGAAAATECIWIIEVPATGANSSVNIVSANISVTGYSDTTKAKLEVRDGGSVRASLLQVDLNATKIPTILSRFNFLWIRYVAPAASNGAVSFNFTVKYSVHNCNKSSQCDNGICLHEDWKCDGLDQCGDNTDERHCNGTQPIPRPTTPAPQPAPKGDTGKKGVAAYWVVICLLIGFGIGVAVVFLIPRVMRKARLRNYHSFQNTENA